MERQNKRNEKLKGAGGLVLLALICEASGAAGALFTSSSVSTWYAEIAKPSFTPPGWVFGPVWTTLYFMMALACWLVLRTEAPRDAKRCALLFFWAQFAANAVWSPLFFGLRMPGLAFADIMLLWLLIALTLKAFFRVSQTAALLFLPYFAWVSFAAVLNGTIWRMNA